jgi:hypothetical protein
MIFPKLNYENIVQVEDKLRLSASKSFSNSGEITDVEIKPSGSDSFYSVFNMDYDKWFLDWAYETEGDKTITVRVTDGSGSEEKDFTITVLSETDDALLSSDSDLFPYEPNIERYMPLGKSSFIYAHRAAQAKILGYLDEQRIWKDDGSRYTKEDLRDITGDEFKEQFRLWSTFQTLLTIFESSQVSSDDVFEEKKQDYEMEMKIHRNRASLRLDGDSDGVVDEQPRNIRTTRLYRR